MIGKQVDSAGTSYDDPSRDRFQVDEASEESFPASDPPSWAPEVAGPPPRGTLVEDEAELQRLVRAMRTVAIVGMKDERASGPAFEIPRRLVEHGMRIIPVNPTITFALGQTAYPSLADVPEPFDAVDVFRHPRFIAELADQILALPEGMRPSVVWLQTGIRDDAAARRLAAAGIDVVQDRCLGVYAARYRRAGIEEHLEHL